jgi:phenylalanyl-tRNA synthetase alpha chain
MDILSIEQEALSELEKLQSITEIEAFSTRYLGRKDGELTKILRALATMSPEEKKTTGQAANRFRQVLEEKISYKQKELQHSTLNAQLEKDQIDGTLPGQFFSRGHSNPILQTIKEISALFTRLGFSVVDGPEVETDFFNFTALNIPKDHPARDLHDTFYLDAHEKATGKEEIGVPLLLRTHTSPVQIRLMKNSKPPVRIIAPGRVYRHEAVDATHAAIFHQIEGLVVDTDVSFADLKGTLTYFANEFFGSAGKVRFRPSYFPFVEPGAEMDVECFICHGTKKTPQGTPCGLCKQSGWIEMLGAGMVHPQVLRNVGIDPEKYSGFAFGMGIERIVMTKHQIRDIRFFLDSDLRFVEQFR